MGLWSQAPAFDEDRVMRGDLRCPTLVRRVMRLSGRSPVFQFALSGLLATLVIGVIAVAITRSTGTKEAIRDAKRVTRLAGEGIVAPAVDEKVLAGDPAAIAHLDDIVMKSVLRDGVVRVKLWRQDGTIVYADEQRLIGKRFPQSEEDRAAFRASEVDAEVSDLSAPENRYERSYDKLLEVYLPIRSTNGVPLRFEVYQKFSSVSAGGRRLWLAFAPALVGGLLLLQLVNLPLAGSLARRLRQGQHEREALLRRALDASETERRVIAADLHDGVVQDLVGVSFALAAQGDRLHSNGDAGAGTALREGAARTRDSVRALRTLLVDIYPPSLHRSGLAAALGDLATTSTSRGLLTTVDVPDDDVHLGATVEQLLFRCAQEALRNALKHAGAAMAVIAIQQDGDRVVLEVSDDGAGFDVGGLAAREADAHFGLAMLSDMVAEVGGSLHVTSRPGHGTQVRMEVPR